MTDENVLTDLIATHGLATLATLKRDGRPQLSVVRYGYERDTHEVTVSVTADRAKTRNLERDPRGTVLVMGDNPWAYAVAEGTCRLGPVAADPHDEATDQLVELYRRLGGEHPDWDEYRAAMVAERRLVLSMVVDHVYGMVG